MDTKRAQPSEQTAPFDLDHLAIDRGADVPIGVQLAWALRSRIADGTFQAGQRLPGLRDLAEEIGVNVNTVRAVYQRLDGEGLIDSRQGIGSFVTSAPPRRWPVEAIAADAAREAEASGVDPRDVAAALYAAPETGQEQAPIDDEIRRRRDLRAQIAGLEHAIVAIEAEHPGVAPAADAPQSRIGPALLGAAQLERVRASLVHRLSTVQSAIDAILDERGESEYQTQSSPGPRATRTAPRRSERPGRPRPTNRPAGAET